MSDDQDHIMASSPEISPQTPTITPSPPLREISMSVSHSGSSSQTSHTSALPPPRDLKSLLSNSPPTSPIANIPTDVKSQNTLMPDKSAANQSSKLFSRSLPPLQPRPPTLPRLNTFPPPIRHSPSASSAGGPGTGIGLDAFKLSSPPARHSQPALQNPSHQGRSFWIPSFTRDNDKPQHQRLASLPSIQTGQRENVYPTPVSLTSQHAFPMSTITPVAHTRRQSEGRHSLISQPLSIHTRHPSAGYPVMVQHPRQQVMHRRHPSSGDANLARLAQHDSSRPAWAAPPPPPPAPTHVVASQTQGRPQSLGRPRLQIHPYAPPSIDPRYYSAGGIGVHAHPHPNMSYGMAMAGYGREGVFASPSSGMSPGGFKAPRKRADDSQLSILNEIFEKTSYPSTDERDDLARRLGMTSRSVQIWFQNRRRAVKVDAQSAVQRAEAEAETQIMIRGPVPIIPRPYPTHARQSSEGEEDHTFDSGMTFNRGNAGMPRDVTIPGSSMGTLPNRSGRDDASLVKKELVSP